MGNEISMHIVVFFGNYKGNEVGHSTTKLRIFVVIGIRFVFMYAENGNFFTQSKPVFITYTGILKKLCTFAGAKPSKYNLYYAVKTLISILVRA